MKKLLTKLLIVGLIVSLSGCGEPQYLNTPNSTYYPTYGFINQDTDKSSKVCYEVSIGNVVWSILLSETIAFPIYFIGFSIYNPVRAKHGPDDKCSNVD